jgi:YD repeat-containing protein
VVGRGLGSRGFPRARLLAVLALACCGLLLAPAADARIKRNWTVQFFSEPNTSTIFDAINDDGHAVGTRVFPDGSRHGLFFDGRRLRDIGARLGATSAILDINNRDQMVGWQSSTPQARLNNLFSGTDPATMPRAFVLSGPVLRVLPFPSVATAVNSNGLVVGSYRENDGTVHTFAWNAASRPRSGRSAQVEGAPSGFVPRGQGTGEDVSDPQAAGSSKLERALAKCRKKHQKNRRKLRQCEKRARERHGTPVAAVDDRGNGATVSISADGGKTWTPFRTLPGNSLGTINDFGRAGGAAFTEDGGTDPIVFDFVTQRHVRLSEIGGLDGVVREIGNNGLMLEQLQGPMALGVGLRDRRNNLIDLNTLFTPAQLGGNTFAIPGGLNSVGQITGTARSPENQPIGFIAIPPVESNKTPLDKIDNLEKIWADYVGRPLAKNDFEDVRFWLSRARTREACDALDALIRIFDAEADRERRGGDDLGIARALRDYSAPEVKRELSCP